MSVGGQIAGVPPVCQCCLSQELLRPIAEPYLFRGKSEHYSRMLAACFCDELSPPSGHICGDCVRRLRAALDFRRSVAAAQAFLASSTRATSAGAVSPSAVESLETKAELQQIIDAEEDTKTFAGLRRTDSLADLLNSSAPDDYPDCSNGLGAEDNRISSAASSEEDNVSDMFSAPEPTEPPPLVNRLEFDVGEQRTLPYVLDNTDRSCEICHKEFSFFGELMKHMPEHYPNHICDICGKICATRKSLHFHSKTHTELRLACQQCDKSFKNKSTLTTHVKVTHNKQKIYFKCSVCGEQLATYNSRIKHMSLAHGREDKAYKCQQCSCRYRLGTHLRAHVRRVHLQEKNHHCPMCGVSFFTKKCLMKHSRKHTHNM